MISKQWKVRSELNVGLAELDECEIAEKHRTSVPYHFSQHVK